MREPIRSMPRAPAGRLETAGHPVGDREHRCSKAAQRPHGAHLRPLRRAATWTRRRCGEVDPHSVRHVILCNRRGAPHANAEHLAPYRSALAQRADKRHTQGTADKMPGARTCCSRSPGPPRSRPPRRGDGPVGDRVCNGQPRPRSAPRGSPRPRRRSPPRDTMTAPTRRTTSSPSPGVFKPRARCSRTHDQRGDELAARARDRNRDPRPRAAPQVDHPERRKLPNRRIGRPRCRRCGDQRREPARTESRRPPPLIRPDIEALEDHCSALEQSGRGTGLGDQMPARVGNARVSEAGCSDLPTPASPRTRAPRSALPRVADWTSCDRPRPRLDRLPHP